MTKASLISLPNLELAWSRITTARNLQHKRMFRHLYSAYEPGRRTNLALLPEQLKGGWKATSPIRVYMPKSSGLLRPLTLLALGRIRLSCRPLPIWSPSHSIVRSAPSRSKQRRSSATALTSAPNSIFFPPGLAVYLPSFSRARLQRHLDAGNQWIAHFDLAAFYETISHRALPKASLRLRVAVREVWQLIRGGLALCDGRQAHGGIPRRSRHTPRAQ